MNHFSELLVDFAIKSIITLIYFVFGGALIVGLILGFLYFWSITA